MKSQIKTLLALILVFALTSAFAATEGASVDTTGGGVDVTASDTTVSTDEGAPVDVDSIPTSNEEEPSEDIVSDSGAEAPLDAASGKEVVVSPKVGIGNYAEVACDKDFFTQNACNQCFDGGKRLVGEKITGLTDSWTNPNTTEQVIYKDEQKLPEMVNIGGANTVWLNNPQELDKFWKFSQELTWTDSATGSGKQEFLLEGGKSTPFLESDLGAAYAIQSTDKAEGDAVGLLKFTIDYHDTDATAKESEIKTHTECVAYYAGTPAAVTPTPVTPQEVTQVKTGPESLILILAALLLSFGLLKYRKKV